MPFDNNGIWLERAALDPELGQNPLSAPGNSCEPVAFRDTPDSVQHRNRIGVTGNDHASPLPAPEVFREGIQRRALWPVVMAVRAFTLWNVFRLEAPILTLLHLDPIKLTYIPSDLDGASIQVIGTIPQIIDDRAPFLQADGVVGEQATLRQDRLRNKKSRQDH
jgi:hypothetical protein